jgi:hypothetical protein
MRFSLRVLCKRKNRLFGVEGKELGFLYFFFMMELIVIEIRNNKGMCVL